MFPTDPLSFLQSANCACVDEILLRRAGTFLTPARREERAEESSLRGGGEKKATADWRREMAEGSLSGHRRTWRRYLNFINLML